MTALAVTSVRSLFRQSSTRFRIGLKFRCIRSTPIEMQSISKNDFECLASTGVKTPVAMSSNFRSVRFNFLEADLVRNNFQIARSATAFRDRSRKAVALRAIWKLFRTKSASRKLNLTDLKLEDIATGVFTPVLARHSKSFLLIDCISIGVDRMQRNFKPMRKRVELWRKSDLTDVTAKAVIYGVCGGQTGCSQAPGPHLRMIATSSRNTRSSGRG